MSRHHRLSPSFLITGLLSLTHITTPVLCKEREGLQPFRLPTDGGKWYGNTGSWSALSVRLGNPPQYVYLLASTSSPSTTTVTSSFCSDTRIAGYDCPDRGGGFDPSISATWKPVDREGPSQYTLTPSGSNTIPREPLNVTDETYGTFGRDTVKFKDWVPDHEDLAVDDIVLAVLNDTSYLTGSLGLGSNQRSFSAEEKSPSLITTLHTKKIIPGKGFGYTAGNFHRDERVNIDVTLGGANLLRYHPHDKHFLLNTDNLPETTLTGLRLESTGNAIWGANRSVLVEPTQVIIDSETPFLHLPASLCNELALLFNLTYHESRNLYTYPSETERTTLARLNLSFHFTLSDSITLSIPFDSLNLALKWPYSNATTQEGEPYFPIKQLRGSTSTPTLGRAFLQDTYLIVDYERKAWSIHQAKFETPFDSDLLMMEEVWNNHSKIVESGVSVGAIAGVVVGVLAGLALLGAAGYYLLVTRKRNRVQEGVKYHDHSSTGPQELGVPEAWKRGQGQGVYSPAEGSVVSEVGDGRRVSTNESFCHEVQGDLEGRYVYCSEMGGGEVRAPVELPAVVVSGEVERGSTRRS